MLYHPYDMHTVITEALCLGGKEKSIKRLNKQLIQYLLWQFIRYYWAMAIGSRCCIIIDNIPLKVYRMFGSGKAWQIWRIICA